MNMGGMAMPGMNMGGMTMTGMNMGGMAMPPNGMPPMNMNGGVAPTQAAAGSYYCPMHPNVRSAVPATCPYCRMALSAL
ncbi:MAG: heavy metal-binding domain-containing protein [Myxococcaceae bacterium]